MTATRPSGAPHGPEGTGNESEMGPEGDKPPQGGTALRDQLRDTLLHHRWGRDDKQWAEHDRHSYDSDCGICQGDVDAIVSVVLHVVEPTVLAAEVDAFHAALDRPEAPAEPEHTGGNAEDCPACRPLIDQPGGVQYPWICPALDRPEGT